MQWTALGLIWRVPKLLARLGLAAAQVTRCRRRALAGFRRGLAEEGMPQAAIDALSEAYPVIDIKAALGAKRRPPAGHGVGLEYRPQSRRGEPGGSTS